MSAKPEIANRVYIGNVDYKAQEDELRQLFADLNVTDVEIPSKTVETRKGPYQRKLGFAFVEFASDADADAAIDQFNGHQFLRRNISIKKAVPPLTEEEKQARNKAYKEKKQAIVAEKKRKKDEARQRQQEQEEALNNGTDESAAATSTAQAPAETAAATKVPDGEPSPDTVFVTNLDYRVTVSTLKGLFKDLEPKWVYIPLRKTQWKGRQQGRRAYNKGIAFVKFPSSELQKKAIAEFNGAEVSGRNIVVDVAINTRANDAERAEEADAAADDESSKPAQNGEPEKKKPRAKSRAKKAKTPTDGAKSSKETAPAAESATPPAAESVEAAAASE